MKNFVLSQSTEASGSVPLRSSSAARAGDRGAGTEHGLVVAQDFLVTDLRVDRAMFTEV
ncbi:hypothetical protein ACWC2T_38505 [Streptomyces sp. NPDC001393]